MMIGYRNSHSRQIKTIAMAVVCLFLLNMFTNEARALAPQAGNSKVYQEMRRMMERRLDAHQGPIDEFIKQHATKARGLSGIPYLEDEFVECVDACGAKNMFARLKTTLISAGGQIQVIFVDSESDLPTFEGKKVWGHAGTFVTVFALENEKETPEGRRKIIARLFHEIRARSTRARELFDKAVAQKEPAEADIEDLMEALQDGFEKENLEIQSEVERGGRIDNDKLRPEFANLTFSIHPDMLSRDYTISGQGTASDDRLGAVKKWLENPTAENGEILSGIIEAFSTYLSINGSAYQPDTNFNDFKDKVRGLVEDLEDDSILRALLSFISISNETYNDKNPNLYISPEKRLSSPVVMGLNILEEAIINTIASHGVRSLGMALRELKGSTHYDNRAKLHIIFEIQKKIKTEGDLEYIRGDLIAASDQARSVTNLYQYDFIVRERVDAALRKFDIQRRDLRIIRLAAALEGVPPQDIRVTKDDIDTLMAALLDNFDYSSATEDIVRPLLKIILRNSFEFRGQLEAASGNAKGQRNIRLIREALDWSKQTPAGTGDEKKGRVRAPMIREEELPSADDGIDYRIFKGLTPNEAIGKMARHGLMPRWKKILTYSMYADLAIDPAYWDGYRRLFAVLSFIEEEKVDMNSVTSYYSEPLNYKLVMHVFKLKGGGRIVLYTMNDDLSRNRELVVKQDDRNLPYCDWAQKIKDMLQSRDTHPLFHRLTVSDDGYLFRGIGGVKGGLIAGISDGRFGKNEMPPYYLSDDFEDANDVTGFSEEGVDLKHNQAILIFKGSLFNSALKKGRAAVEYGGDVGFFYPFFVDPLRLEDIEYILVSPSTKEYFDKLVTTEPEELTNQERSLRKRLLDQDVMKKIIVYERADRWQVPSTHPPVFKRLGIVPAKRQNSDIYPYLALSPKDLEKDSVSRYVTIPQLPAGREIRIESKGSAETTEDRIALPEEWYSNVFTPNELTSKISELLKLTSDLDHEKSVFIFSEKVTFDKGLGVFLPKLAKSGMKVAVVATNDKQRALIDELNKGKPEHERIIYADTIADIKTKVHTARCYYFKVNGDLETDLQGIITFDITEIVKKIIDVLGKLSGIIEREKLELLHDAARKFAEAA
jgi:hypothetical protein